MEATKKSKVVILAFFVGIILIGMMLYKGMAAGGDAHMEVIQQVISDQGGELLPGGVTAVSVDVSPFERSGKGNTIFRISYQKDGNTYTAWYRAKNQSSIIAEPEEWIFP
ncbi:hypothetical protein ACAF76_009950 [Brevibacillus sp. TJ4]|uniref:hypothetical protein n=1 Tax=Brevibacillus sp. TJ4 TaxID=3234853 RepID=UPI003BA16257